LLDQISAMSGPNGSEAVQSWMSGLCSVTTTVEEKKNIFWITLPCFLQKLLALFFLTPAYKIGDM